MSDGLGAAWKAHGSTWSQTLLVMCAWSRPGAWVPLMPCLVSFQVFQVKKDKMVSLMCLNVTQWNGLGGKRP